LLPWGFRGLQTGSWGFHGLNTSPVPSDFPQTGATKKVGRTGVWEWQRPWQQLSALTDFLFSVVIFFGSLSAKLNYLDFLGESRALKSCYWRPADCRFGAFWVVLWLKIR
jgi:hypothetical protein